MQLYKITTLFLGKDLHESAILGYLAAENDEAVYQYISDHIAWGEPWETQYEKGAKERIMEKCNDFEEEYLGEFYDQKYGWERVSPLIADDELEVLKRYGILFK